MNLSLEPIPESQLPPASALGKLYERREEVRERLSVVERRLNQLRTQHETTELWLRKATLNEATPEAFATETAREILLTRAIDAAKFEYGRVYPESVNVDSRFRSEYSQYREHLRYLRECRDGDGQLTETRQEGLVNRVKGAVGVA